MVSGVPRTHPQSRWFSRMALRAQHMVFYTVVAYGLWFVTVKGAPQDQQRVKMSEIKSAGNRVQASKSCLPVESSGHTEFPQQWVVTTCVKCHLPGTLINDSVPRDCSRSWSHRYPLPSIYQNSRLPEGRLVLSLSHSIYLNSLRNSEPFLSGNGGKTLEIQVPGHQPRDNLISWSFWG